MRLVGPLLLRQAFRLGYRTEEVEQILDHTTFSSAYRVEAVTVAGLPVWMRIELFKQQHLEGDPSAQEALPSTGSSRLAESASG